tara:strand:+ start:501 stop:1487 length:987 start_codon:yes stop_codon:yes gene_type:complete
MDNKDLMKVDLTTPSISSTYAGEYAGKYISAALLENTTISRELISVNQNIKYKWVVNKGVLSGIIADGTCDFTDAGVITTTERILEPITLQVNLQLCKADFRSDWEAVSMGYSAYDSMPPIFTDWLTAQILGQVAQQIETTIWMGNAATAGEFGGFVELMTADGDVIDVAGASIGAGGVTAANVLVELGKVETAIPKAVYGKQGCMIAVADNVFRAYVSALAGYQAGGIGASGTDTKGNQWFAGDPNTPLYFNGIPVQRVEGLDANYMVAYEKENLWFGTGVLNDSNELRIVDTSEILGDQNVRFIARWTSGVQYGLGAECVLYTPVA